MELNVIYEDNHIIAVNKTHHDLVQKDVTGDISLDDKVRQYIKEKYNKMLFNVHRKSSEEIEGLKREIKTLGGKGSYFYDPND